MFYQRDGDGLERFDSRSDEGIFLGYSTHSKAYKCFNKRLKKVVESVNVKVDEDLHKGRQTIVNQIEDSHIEDEEQFDGEQEEAPSKSPNRYVQKNHPEDQIVGNRNEGVQTRKRLAINNEQVNFFLMSEMEPKTYDEATTD